MDWLWAVIEPSAWRPDLLDAAEFAYLYGRVTERTPRGLFQGVVAIPRYLLAEDFDAMVTEAQDVLRRDLAFRLEEVA